jgi:hypothetical protein
MRRGYCAPYPSATVSEMNATVKFCDVMVVMTRDQHSMTTQQCGCYGDLGNNCDNVSLDLFTTVSV